MTLWVVNPGTPNAKQGNDVFVIRDGKIRFQTTTGVKLSSRLSSRRRAQVWPLAALVSRSRNCAR